MLLDPKEMENPIIGHLWGQVLKKSASQNVFGNQTKNASRSQKLFQWLVYLTPPNIHPPQKQGSIRPDCGKPMLNKPPIRPYF